MDGEDSTMEQDKVPLMWPFRLFPSHTQRHRVELAKVELTLKAGEGAALRELIV
jgi:hypothetical protein